MSIVSRHSAFNYWPLLALIVLVILGIALGLGGVIDWRYLLRLAQGYTLNWWLLPLLIVIQIVLYTFALPGSMILWVVAPLYEPVVAVPALVAGSTLGALSAYLFARREVMSWVAHVRKRRIFTVLQAHGGFLTLCALRTMPNFPQSVVNYGAGILRLPIGPFIVATVIGFAVKNTLYCSVIHGAVNATNPWDLISLSTLAPLLIVVILLVFAEILQVRWTAVNRSSKRRK